MIYEAFDKQYTAIYYPRNKEYREQRWNDFMSKPQPTMSMALSHADLKELIKKREADHHEQVKTELVALRSTYESECHRVNTAFRKALATEYLTKPNHPKEQMLWEKAWAHGHASGYSDVESWYQDLSELIN